MKTILKSPRLDPELKCSLLLEVAQKVRSTLDLTDVLKRLLEYLRSAVEYDAAGIFVLRQSTPLTEGPWSHLIVGMATLGFPERPTSDDPMLRSGQGIVGHVIRTGETVIARDVRLDSRYVDGRKSTLSEIALPIISNGQVIGALNLESDRLGAFTAREAALLEFFAIVAAISIEKAILCQQALDKQWLEHQLTIARDVQSSLLPSAPPATPGYDIAGINLPTWAISGDYYDFIPLAEGRLGLVIADVAGKGVSAALIMATFRAALRAELQRSGEALSIAEEVNRALLDTSDYSRFVTAFYGILDPLSGRFDYVNCGHDPPFVLRSNGALEFLREGGPVLGIPMPVWFQSSSATLARGDMLVLFTDGLIEVESSGGEIFGKERLEEVLRRCSRLPAGKIIHSVMESTRSFSGKDVYEDDFTLVVAKREDGTQ
jgi:serine phosphatase RsbU (regulator of sigma subunit)